MAGFPLSMGASGWALSLVLRASADRANPVVDVRRQNRASNWLYDGHRGARSADMGMGSPRLVRPAWHCRSRPVADLRRIAAAGTEPGDRSGVAAGAIAVARLRAATGRFPPAAKGRRRGSGARRVARRPAGCGRGRRFRCALRMGITRLRCSPQCSCMRAGCTLSAT